MLKLFEEDMDVIFTTEAEPVLNRAMEADYTGYATPLINLFKNFSF